MANVSSATLECAHDCRPRSSSALLSRLPMKTTCIHGGDGGGVGGDDGDGVGGDDGGVGGGGGGGVGSDDDGGGAWW